MPVTLSLGVAGHGLFKINQSRPLSGSTVCCSAAAGPSRDGQPLNREQRLAEQQPQAPPAGPGPGPTGPTWQVWPGRAAFKFLANPVPVTGPAVAVPKAW